MDDELYKNINRALHLEHENAEHASRLLQEAMNRGEKNIDMLDRIADRLLDSMNGFSGVVHQVIVFFNVVKYIVCFFRNGFQHTH